MFSVKPSYIAFIRVAIMMNMIGKMKSEIKDIHQPLKKANAKAAKEVPRVC